MTPEQLLALIASWRDGDCPPEILLDAISEYGVDVDAHSEFLYSEGRLSNSIRDHLLGAKGGVSCSSAQYQRDECTAIKWLERELRQKVTS